MQIAKPQVHLTFDEVNEVYLLHAVTWMDRTKFREDGYSITSTVAVNGVYTVMLKIKEEPLIPDMQLLTPIVHTLELTGIELGEEDPFIDIIAVNSTTEADLGKTTKNHYEDADTTGV